MFKKWINQTFLLVVFSFATFNLWAIDALKLPFPEGQDVYWKLLKGKKDNAEFNYDKATKTLVLVKKSKNVNNYIASPKYDVSKLQGQSCNFTFSYKLEDYQHIATKPWHGANSQIMFYNKQGKRKILGAFTFTDEMKQFKKIDATFKVPTDAVKMEIRFSILNSIGKFTIKGISLSRATPLTVKVSNTTSFQTAVLVPQKKKGMK